MQGLALRGHRDHSSCDSTTNKGNFIAILEMIAKRDPLLKEHLNYCKKNQSYTSKRIQNELIMVIGTQLRQKILQPLSQVQYYSVMADEVTDPCSNEEILSLCVRFVDTTSSRPSVKEVFLDFIYLERTTGRNIATQLLDSC